MSETVGILGVGHLAGFLVEGLALGDERPGLVFSPRNAARAHDLATRFGGRVAEDNGGVVREATLVVLATRPEQAVDAIRGLSWRDDQVLVSVAAGVSLAALKAVAAQATVVRAMPVSCAAIGESPTTLYPDEPRARALFARLGPVHALPDEATFSAASVHGATYAWVFALLQELEDWTTRAGVDPATSRALAAQILRGASGTVLAGAEASPGEQLQSLATPGGITEQGLTLLRERGALSAWGDACQAVRERLRG